ncbi:MAG: lipocalin-like domain-containing protein [Woeseiaceae bacterium]|nr:lipocalin-like domain-containing protein [Woeseiaceae bacterium]
MRYLLSIGLLFAFSAFAQESNNSELADLLGSEDMSGFVRAIEPYEFSFPRDHGPHPEFRNEWWYITGNLDGERDRRFGFELTIFRFSLTPDEPEKDSDWRTNQVYIAHFAVTDADRERFYVAERYSRGALGIAGAEADPFRVWIDDWEITGSGQPERWQLTAADEDFALDLALTALKPPALNGDEGLSQKSDEPGNASYYYTIPRWQSEGTLRLGDDTFTVSGLSWLDREWSSSALASDQKGWDWFALQLSDGSELMYYNIRKDDGSQDRNSSGTWIDANGNYRYLSRDEVTVTVNDYWDSPEGGRYPGAWTVEVQAVGLVVDVEPVIADQELFTTVRYWEGAVDVEGTRNGNRVEGRGYVELTGYAD